jgi:hypothetical protein
MLSKSLNAIILLSFSTVNIMQVNNILSINQYPSQFIFHIQSSMWCYITYAVEELSWNEPKNLREKDGWIFASLWSSMYRLWLSYLYTPVTQPSRGASVGMALISVTIISKELLPLTWKEKSKCWKWLSSEFRNEKTNTVLTHANADGIPCILALCKSCSTWDRQIEINARSQPLKPDCRKAQISPHDISSSIMVSIYLLISLTVKQSEKNVSFMKRRLKSVVGCYLHECLLHKVRSRIVTR